MPSESPVLGQPATVAGNHIRINTRDKISVKLTDEEIRDRAMLLPKLMSDKDSIEAEAKTVAKDYKKKIDRTNAILKDMVRVVDSGEEYREVECVKVFDIEKGIVWLEFNGRKYEQRSATEKELEIVRQGTMYDEPAPTEEIEGEDEDDNEDEAESEDSDETAAF